MRFGPSYIDLCWKRQRRKGKRERKIKRKGKGKREGKEREITSKEKMIFLFAVKFIIYLQIL